MANARFGPVVLTTTPMTPFTAAGLDVFDIEPLPGDSPLLDLDNVILTPHLGSTSEEAVALAGLGEELKRVVLGGEVQNVVNPEARDSAKPTNQKDVC